MRPVKILLPVVVLCGLLAAGSAFAPSHQPTPVDTTAVVAAWNIEGFNPIPIDEMHRIARGLADLDAEVIALSEVNPDHTPDVLVAELQDHGAFYHRRLLDQTASQNLAILYKDGVEVSNARLIPGSDDGNDNLRKALAVDVRIGNFDFILIAVHMKASRGASNRAIRNRQAEAIATFITAETAGTEKDVLLVGDYNMIPGEDDENFQAMSPTGFLRFVSSQDLVGQGSHINDDGSIGNLLDGYAVSDGHTAEYIEGSLRIFPVHRAMGKTLVEFRSDVSDHLPLVARFRVVRDDD